MLMEASLKFPISFLKLYSMKKCVKQACGLCVSVGMLLTAIILPSDNATAAPGQSIACPASLSAPYGGNDGWSSIQVQANFADALVSEGLMTCQYGFGVSLLNHFSGFSSSALLDLPVLQRKMAFSSNPSAPNRNPFHEANDGRVISRGDSHWIPGVLHIMEGT